MYDTDSLYVLCSLFPKMWEQEQLEIHKDQPELKVNLYRHWHQSGTSVHAMS